MHEQAQVRDGACDTDAMMPTEAYIPSLVIEL